MRLSELTALLEMHAGDGSDPEVVVRTEDSGDLPISDVSVVFLKAGGGIKHLTIGCWDGQEKPE